MNSFGEWLRLAIKKSGLTQRELSQLSGYSQSQISQVITGEKRPTYNFCTKIAPHLLVPESQILTLAGILPSPADSDDPTLAELQDLIQNLPPAKRKDVLRYVRFLFQSDKEE